MPYTLLVAEDEQWVRKGLAHGFDWSSLGVQTVLEASDGKEALEIARARHPDIVITDIRMPEIDGLHLIMMLSEEQPGIRYIIVSGYADFNYAKTAMYLGVSEYITKPVDKQMLLAAVANCTQRIEMERSAQDEQACLRSRLRELQQQEQSALLREMVTEKWADEPDRFERLRATDMEQLAEGKWLVIALAVNEARRVKAMHSVAEWEEREASIADAFEKQLGDRFRVLCRPMEEGRFLCAVSGLTRLVQTTQHATLQAALQQVAQACNWPLSAGVGVQADHLAQWPQAWIQACAALESSFFYGGGRVYWWEKPETPSSTPQREEFGIITEVEVEQRALDALLRQDEDALRNTIPYFRHALLQQKPRPSVDEAMVRVLRAGEYIHRRLTVQGVLTASEAMGPLAKLHECCHECDTLDWLCDCFMETLLTWLPRCIPRQQSTAQRIIRQAQAYMEANYGSDISLTEVAEHVHLNTAYLSKLFSQTIGTPYSQYLMRLRIEKAKQLLINSAIQIQSVARQVGYPDIKSFNRAFKRVTGGSPGDFRTGKIR